MKNLIIAGVVLVVLGIGALTYNSISYTTEEEVLKIGELEATAQKEKTIPLPPILGGALLAGGAIMIVVGVKKK